MYVFTFHIDCKISAAYRLFKPDALLLYVTKGSRTGDGSRYRTIRHNCFEYVLDITVSQSLYSEQIK